ncbi:hypothetical protein QMA77_24080 [Pantoea ananatis]|uniref:hypothetical protein n=1 Tax=Pantoea TaxID=53335 RepID=UPI000B5A2AC0|nr:MULTISPECIES: hypothetical protein [Pantoea]MCV3301130.1 hypothetical protein [Pantoea ananatis]MDI6539992.1 hypothetical protein [Pantoea ananatis]OWY74656.1 hypothetical protein CDN97_21815 [Pantoea sp. AMG 501]
MGDLIWQFDDQPNTAVIANRKIFTSGEWISYVCHDSEDGCWQFHINHTTALNEEDAVLVSLESVINLDLSLNALADLPLGWFAWRASMKGVWKRARKID